MLRCCVLHPQSEVGAQFYETLGLEGEIALAIRKLKEWAAPRPVEKNLLTISDTVFIRPEPLGVVLIIGAWNYPWAVTIQPLVGAIAAGTAGRLWPCASSGQKDRLQVRVHTKGTRSAFTFWSLPATPTLWDELWESSYDYDLSTSYFTQALLNTLGSSPRLVSDYCVKGRAVSCQQRAPQRSSQNHEPVDMCVNLHGMWLHCGTKVSLTWDVAVVKTCRCRKVWCRLLLLAAVRVALCLHCLDFSLDRVKGILVNPSSIIW